ncbi:MAG: signal recognition particle protein [Thermaerobacter sp.]|nr:signal recognition particle protein [Thermaerobacter sp.]
MFEQLQERLRQTFDRLRGRGKLTPDDIKKALREVRIALLDADVHFSVARDFVTQLEPKLLGEDVMASLTPGQTVVKHVHEALRELLGEDVHPLRLRGKAPHAVLLLGLQGAGKTTFAAKLALRLKQEQRWPLLVACDLKRPAAIEQLAVLGERIGVPVQRPETQDPVEAARAGLARARRDGQDVVLIDTAGRQEVDADLMAELQAIHRAVDPAATILVLDAMTGQAALGTAETFAREVGIDGVVLSKVDGDARGGAALSVRAATGKPILFASTGERPEQLEAFSPDRMAQRILGMGDVMGLIERAQAQAAEGDTQEMEKRLRKGQVTLDDLMAQLQTMRKMGSVREILGMIPGLGRKVKDQDVDEKQIGRSLAILQSMTRLERRDPRLLDASRRRRIAKGSGTSVSDVNRMLRQFEEMRRMAKAMRGMRGKMPPMPPLERR